MPAAREFMKAGRPYRGLRILHPAALALALSLQAAPGLAQSGGGTAELKRLSLEDLGKIEITSVTKQAEALSDAPAAIYVITNEDIRRSGLRSIPEILRLAPNLQVAQSTANAYAISARGFNGTTANKLLVLIDGRSVYTPLFSGVFWDIQDVVPEDIDRIEVISGPGGTLWGANAVNGVINIVTRHSRDTQGGLLALGAGSVRKDGLARYGGGIGENGSWRIYGKGFEVENTDRANGTRVRDGWEKAQGGFRFDWGKEADAFTVQGDIYDGSLENAQLTETAISGHNLVSRWTRQFAGGSSLQVQLYLDHTERTVPRDQADKVSIYDLDVQYALAPLDRHNIVVGGGYRLAQNDFRNTATVVFVPPSRELSYSNVFVQDEIALGDRLRLILGIRLEDNSYTGISPLPSARLSWKVTDTDLVWSAVSRAVRTPSRLDRDLFQISGGTTVLAGGPNFTDEKLTAFELGYRGQFSPRASLSVSAFYNIYDDLRSLEATPGTTLPITFGNMMEGETYGIETWGSYTATDWWRLSAGATFMRQDLGFKAGSRDIGGIQAAGNDPKRQVMLRSSMNLTETVELDIGLRAIGSLPNPAVPSYIGLDARLGWNIAANADISLVGTNLLDDHHPEFGSAASRSQFERAVLVLFRGRF